MATSYPSGLDNFTNPTSTDKLDSATVPHATQHTNINDAVEAIETELGINPKGSSASVDARLTTIETTVALKAPLASPALTGTPTAPTATAGDNTTQIATTAFVGTAVSNLVASAPATLDTLNELALALGSDANFSTTITNSIAAKAPIASPTFTGTVSGITKSMVGLSSVDNTADTAKPVSTAQQTALDLKAPIASPTFTGTVTIPTGSAITGVPYLASANTFTGGVQQITTATAGTKGFIVQASASQTANLSEWQNSAGTVLTSISSAGVITSTANMSALGIRAAASLCTSSVAVTSIVTNATSGHVVIQNGGTVPNTPTGGGVIYVESGALKYKGSSGTITVLAPA
jgi:hypothetical protein